MIDFPGDVEGRSIDRLRERHGHLETPDQVKAAIENMEAERGQLEKERPETKNQYVPEIDDVVNDLEYVRALMREGEW